VGDGDLIGIGRFAVLAGLSIVALRHYDEVGLLTPALVDARSGYRRYQLEQVRVARMIGALRAIDVPIDATTSRTEYEWPSPRFRACVRSIWV